MSVEPMEFLAEAYATAKAQGVLDIPTPGEREAVTLRLQFYNLLRKCRRLAARSAKGELELSPMVEQLVRDAEAVMIALPADLPGTLRFCRPEYSPTAKVMLGALEGSAAGKAVLERVAKAKAEARAAAEAEAREIRESELREIAKLGQAGPGQGIGGAPTGPEASAAKRKAKYLGEGGA